MTRANLTYSGLLKSVLMTRAGQHSYHILSYHFISYHVISHIISHLIYISYHVVSHPLNTHITSYPITSYHVKSHIISYHICLTSHIISYHIISYHIISYHYLRLPFGEPQVEIAPQSGECADTRCQPQRLSPDPHS